jgi:hypothetical protein
MQKLLFVSLGIWGFTSVGLAQNQKIDSLKRALKSYTQSDTHHINILNELGDLYYGINPDSILILAENAFSFAQKSHYDKGMVEALNNKGRFFG